MFNTNNFVSKLMFFLGLFIITLTLPGCESLATRSFSYVLELCLGAGAVLFLIGCILLEIGRLMRKFFFQNDTNVNILYILPTFIAITILFMFAFFLIAHYDSQCLPFTTFISVLLSISITLGIFSSRASNAFFLLFSIMLCASFGAAMYLKS